MSAARSSRLAKKIPAKKAIKTRKGSVVRSGEPMPLETAVDSVVGSIDGNYYSSSTVSRSVTVDFLTSIIQRLQDTVYTIKDEMRDARGGIDYEDGDDNDNDEES